MIFRGSLVILMDGNYGRKVKMIYTLLIGGRKMEKSVNGSSSRVGLVSS